MSKLATITFEVHDDGTMRPVVIEWAGKVTPKAARTVVNRLMGPVGTVIRDMIDIITAGK